MIFNCKEDNDLYKALKDLGYTYPCFNSLDEAIQKAPEGSGILVLGDDYPVPCFQVNDEILNIVRTKDLRLYIEYPASFPGMDLKTPQMVDKERVVVSSEFFGDDLHYGSILSMHGCWFLPCEAESSHLVLARVAGYREAVYGLPDETFPLLLEVPEHEILIATSKLSGFITGRYGPTNDWKALWEKIFQWLTRSCEVPILTWKPAVDVIAHKEDKLPKSIELDAFKRSVDWFKKNVVYSISSKKGAIEGFESRIDYEGQQLKLNAARADCLGETGMLFAYDWAVSKNPHSRQLAGEILDYTWSSPDFFQGDRTSSAYGLLNWMKNLPAFYGDDNARVILSTLTARRLLHDDRWDEPVLKCLLGNLRTTGPLGFRRDCIRYSNLEKEDDWRIFNSEETISYSPHYQAYLWAAYLWAFELTGYEEFLEKAKNAIEMTMNVYPKLRWTNGLTQEIARMLLPLAFLVRIEDNRKYREWLRKIVEELLAYMQPCGAIYEQMGSLENGKYPSPRCNADYGTTEASIIQKNGDPACDLLYTANFAFLGLHEASVTTGDPIFKEAEEKLADFLCRIQVKSSEHPYLNGSWMRSFDTELWEYWGSEADHGWSAWCVESGWTNTWIASVFGMRHLNEGLFSEANTLNDIFPRVLKEMS